jgi:4-amino-4-deoxy-L-arabinose transferase-like glycosyltransferase
MPPSSDARSVAAWTGRCLPAVVALALGAYAYRVLLPTLPPLQADEAGHALPAARMALALAQGDLAAFLELTRRDILWPFFHPLFIGVFLLAFGTTADVARASSLCAFVATIALVPLLVRELARPPAEAPVDGGPPPTPSPTLGWLSAAALVGAPSLWGFGCAAMTESLGMLMVLGTLLCAARAERKQSLALHAASGVLVALTFFTKYNYGVPLALALFAALAFRARVRGPRPLAAFCAGVVPLLVAWAAFVFGTDRARLAFVWSYIRASRDEGIHGLEGVLFYPRGVVEVLGAAVGIGLLLGLLAAFRRRAPSARLPSLLFVSLTFVLLLPHATKQWRYVAPAMPVLLALAEAELGAWAAARFRRHGLAWGLLSASLLLARNPLEGIRHAVDESRPFAEAGSMLRFASLHLPPDRPVLVLGSCGLLPHTALAWQLLERDGREPEVDVMLFPFEDGWDPRYRSAYPTDMRPEYATTLDAALAGRSPTVVAFELGERSPFLPDWMARWDAWGQNYVEVMKAQAGYALAAERAFPDSDATVRVYVGSPP